MITLKELENVSRYPRLSPFPGEEYAKETFEIMKKQLLLYEKFFKGKEYSIIFSDGEEIDFQILEKNICHMLGIDYNNFFEGDYYKDFLNDVMKIDAKPTSYDWVRMVLDSADNIVDYDSSNKGNRAMNYFKSKIKCSIFEKLFELEEFNFGKLQTSDGTKLLYTQSNEPISPYFCIRLKNELDNQYGNQRKTYIINSLLAPQFNELKEYFTEEASIPTQIMVDDNSNVTSKTATPQQKIFLLNQYKSIILACKNSDRLNIYGDYVASLSQFANSKKIR